MTSQELAHLIKMINQIAASFDAASPSQAAGKTAEHVEKFWAPSMRALIVAHLGQGGEDLSPAAREAVALLAA